MIDLSVFRLTVDTKQTPTQISSELNKLRQGVNKQFYASLNREQQEFFHYFVWEVLHSLWRNHPSSSVRIACSTTVSHILVRLAPFFATDFMGTLRDAILNTTEESFLYLSSFVYLAKFHSLNQLSIILSETPILHLFSISDSAVHLPDLVRQISTRFPIDFLKTAAEFFLTRSYKDTSNRHLPKAASIIIETDIQEFSSMIHADIPLVVLDAIFPHDENKRVNNKKTFFPTFPEEVVQEIKRRSIEEIIKSVNPNLESDKNSLETNINSNTNTNSNTNSNTNLNTNTNTSNKSNTHKTNVNTLACYESACRILSKLIHTNQIDPFEITDIITDEMITKSPSLTSLLMLPVNEKLIRKMFRNESYVEETVQDLTPCSSTSNISLRIVSSQTSLDSLSLSSMRFPKVKSVLNLDIDNSQVIPLLTYVSNNFEKFQEELISLISKTFSQISEINSSKNSINLRNSFNNGNNNDNSNDNYNNTNININNSTSSGGFASYDTNYSFALQTLGKVSNKLPQLALNELITKSLLINTNNWIHRWWTLRMLGKVKFTHLQQSVSDKAFDMIESAVISRSNKLQETAKKVSIKIFSHCKTEIFKLFIDKFCRKFDMFDQASFECRVSFLSYIFRNTPSTWTISFIHIANLLTEAVGLIPFSNNVLMEIFTIIGVLAQNLKEPALVLLFSKQALNIIEPSYQSFVGEPFGMGKPPLFSNPLSSYMNLLNNNNSKNVIDYNQMNAVDLDLTSNPGIWHSMVLQSMEAAFRMISNVQWGQYSLISDDICYLFFLASKLLNLFPNFSNSLITSLLNDVTINVPYLNVESYLTTSLKISLCQDGLSILTLCRLFSMISERYPSQNKNNNQNSFDIKSFNCKELIKTLNLSFPIMREIDFLLVLSVQKFMSFFNNPNENSIDFSDDTYLNVVKKSQRHLIDESYSYQKYDQQDDVIDENLLYGSQLNDEDTNNYSPNNANANASNSNSVLSTSESPNNSILTTNLDNSEVKVSEIDFDDIPLTEDLGLLSCCSSLSPFYKLHLEVPQELLKMPIIYSFCLYSTVKISVDEANQLLDKVLLHGTNRILYFVLRYFLRMGIKGIDYSSRITHPFFNNKSILNCVLPFLKGSITLPDNEYILQVILGNSSTSVSSMTAYEKEKELISFVLNSTTMNNKRLSINIIKIDPMFFLKNFMKIEKLKYNQILNLVIYAGSINFPPDEFFLFASKLISKTINSHKKQNLSRRLFTVFIASNKTNKEIMLNALNLLACEVIPLANSLKNVNELTAAQLVEFYFECIIISKSFEIIFRPKIETNSTAQTTTAPSKPTATPSTPISTPSAANNIIKKTFLQKNILDKITAPLAPIKNTKAIASDDVSSTNTSIGSVIKTLLTIFYGFNSKNSALLINSTKGNNENFSNLRIYNIYGATLTLMLNPLQSIPPEIIHQMLLSPTLSISCLPFRYYGEQLRQNQNYDFLPTQTIDYMLHYFTNSSINLNSLGSLNISASSSTGSSTNNDYGNNFLFCRTCTTQPIIMTFLLHFLNFRKLQRLQMKESFYFFHKNVDVYPSCAFVIPVLQLYNIFLALFFQKTPEMTVVVDFVDKLFEFPVVPNGSIEVLSQASIRSHDPTHTQMILTPYLKMKDSYSMYSVCENNAIYSLNSIEQQLRLQKQNSNLNQSQNQNDTTSNSSAENALVEEVTDAIGVVQIAKSFYATFNGIVAVEKLKKGLKHDLMKGLFKDQHEMALKLIEDEHLKVFSVLFALISEDASEIPQNLVDYVNITKKIIIHRKQDGKQDIEENDSSTNKNEEGAEKDENTQL